MAMAGRGGHRRHSHRSGVERGVQTEQPAEQSRAVQSVPKSNEEDQWGAPSFEYRDVLGIAQQHSQCSIDAVSAVYGGRHAPACLAFIVTFEGQRTRANTIHLTS